MTTEIFELTRDNISACAALLFRMIGNGAEPPFSSRAMIETYTKWHWDNPCHRPDVPVGIGVRKKSELGGVMLICPVPFDVFGERQVFLLAQDFFVLPEFRPAGLEIWTCFRKLRVRYQLYDTSAGEPTVALWKRSGAKNIFGAPKELRLFTEIQIAARTAPPAFEGEVREIEGATQIPTDLRATDQSKVSLAFDIGYLSWKSGGPFSHPVRYWAVVGEHTNCVVATRLESRRAPGVAANVRTLDIVHLWGKLDPDHSAAILTEIGRHHSGSADLVTVGMCLTDVFREQLDWGLFTHNLTSYFVTRCLFLGSDEILAKLWLTPLAGE
jgi:hypothetical protein